MPLTPDQIPLSNDLTEAADKLDTPSLVIKSNGLPHATYIALTDGTKLGLIQSVNWGMDVQGRSFCTVTTCAAPAELRVLAKDVRLYVRPAAGYHPFRYLWDWYSTKLARWIHPSAAPLSSI